MARVKKPQNNFAKALQTARKSLELSQEDFSLASSRTYVSALERGIKTPTLTKVDELAEVMDLHPLTLIALSYLPVLDEKSFATLLQTTNDELHMVLVRTNSRLVRT